MRNAPSESRMSPLELPLTFDPRKIHAALHRLDAMDRNNLIWAFFIGASAPAFGSLLSVIVWSTFIWAIMSFLAGRLPVRANRNTVAIVVATFAYAAVKILFTFAHSGLDTWQYWQSLLIFFSPMFFLFRLRLSNRAKMLDSFVLGSGFSTLLAVPHAAYETFWLGRRADTFCGNPGVFAVMALVFGSIGVLNVMSSRNDRRWLGILSYFAMVFCVFASGLRTAWVMLPFVSAIILWAVGPTMPKRLFRRGLALSLAAVLLGVSFASAPLIQRVEMFEDDIANIRQSGDYQSSTGLRLLMYQGAWRAIEAAPLAGYGLAGRMNAVRQNLPQEWRRIPFTHPHNGFLAALLDAGAAGLVVLMVVLAAPVWIAAVAPRDAAWRLRMAIGVSLTASYVITGMTGIIFEHDIMDSAFVITLVILAASANPDEDDRLEKSQE